MYTCVFVCADGARAVGRVFMFEYAVGQTWNLNFSFEN